MVMGVKNEEEKTVGTACFSIFLEDNINLNTFSTYFRSF